MKFQELANQYKGRHLEFEIKPDADLHDTIFEIGIAKARSMKTTVKKMMEEKIEFDLMAVRNWSRADFRKGKWRDYTK